MSDMTRGGWVTMLLSTLVLAGLAAVESLWLALMVLAAVGVLVGLLIIHVGMLTDHEVDGS